MDLYPAVDIRGGKAVRLLKGDYGHETVYDADPVFAAKRWLGQGARRLHIVDLDGARSGWPVNLDRVRAIVDEVSIPIQLGGGLRKIEDVEKALEIGVERVVLGTAALEDQKFLRRAVERFSDRVVVSIDVREGKVATAGWLATSTLATEEAVEYLEDQGVSNLIYTDIGRDGTLEGPNMAEIDRLATKVKGSLLVAGGIGKLEDLQSLYELKQPRLVGVVVGKALYEGKFTVEQGQAALNGYIR